MLGRWREVYSCVQNPVAVVLPDTREVHLAEESIITATQVILRASRILLQDGVHVRYLERLR